MPFSDSDQARFRRLEELFLQAVEIADANTREAFIRAACGDDGSLQADLAAMIECDLGIQRRTAQAGGLPVALGPYECVRMVGRGGMGVVYEARRVDGEFDKRVAIKVINAWTLSPAIREQFRRERQILAHLEHPGIARLLDGGVAADGSPYLVMEFVEGDHIDAFCQTRNLGVAARSDLFGQVLDAVEYAHANGVVHRDLKPANILVDQRNRVRIVDFGTARLAAPTATAGETRLRWFSPEYSSPELIAGEPTDQRSDIFSLGVIYQRLWGAQARPDIVARTKAPLPEERFATVDQLRAAIASRPPSRGKVAIVSAAAATSFLAAALTAAFLYAYFTRPTSAVSELRISQVGASRVALSADAQWVAYESVGASRRIWLMPTDRSADPKPVTRDEAVSERQPALSADGSVLVYRSETEPVGLHSIRLQNGAAVDGSRRLIARQGYRPRISPDGRWVAYFDAGFTRADWMVGANVWVSPIDGSAPGRPVSSNRKVTHMVWAQDSSRLAVVHPSSDSFDLASVSWAGGEGGSGSRLMGSFPQSTTLFELCEWDGANRLQVASTARGTAYLDRIRLTATPGVAPQVETRTTLSNPQLGGCETLRDGRIAISSEAIDSRIFSHTGDVAAAVFPNVTPAVVEPKPDVSIAAISASADGSVLAWREDQKVVVRSPQGVWESAGLSITAARNGRWAWLKDSAGMFQISLPGFLRSPVRTLTQANVWDVSPSGRFLLIVGHGSPRPVALAQLDTESLQNILVTPEANLYLATFSPDEEWISFTAEDTQYPARIFVAPFRRGKMSAREEWIEMARGGYPAWAPSGDRIYFVEPGALGIATVGFDAARRRPAGAVQRVTGFPDGWTIQAMIPGAFRLAVTRDRLLFALSQRRTTVAVTR